MNWAITPHGIGAIPGSRAIREGWDLLDGETFTWPADTVEGLVLAEDEASLRAGTPQELAPQPTNQAYLYAIALLGITPGEVSGIGVSSKFSAAIYFDVGLYYLFFADTQPDMEYLAKAYDDVLRVCVSEKTTEYIVITASDNAGNPTDPAAISVEIIRVS